MKRSVRVPLYGVTVVFTDDHAEARKEEAKHLTSIEAYMDAKAGADLDDPELTSPGHARSASGVVVVCVEDAGCLVHELSHAAFEVLENVGIPIGYRNQEPHAYLIQWLYDQWQEKMNGQG